MTDPDLRTLRHDDRLLDRLGRGEQVGDGDVEAMLGAWRQTLPAAGRPDPRLVAAVTAPRTRPGRRVARTSLGVAASVALLTGGLMAGAAYVNPDSPLWPVTQFVYGDVSDSPTALDDARHAVTDARSAVEHHRYDDAKRLLTTADDLAAKVTEPDAAKRLRDDIADLRHKLPAVPRTTADSTTVHPAGGVDAPPAPPGDAAPRDNPDRPGGPEHGPDIGPGHDDGPGFGRDDHDEDHHDGDRHDGPSRKGKANMTRPHYLLPAE
jgi:hypothetical protein